MDGECPTGQHRKEPPDEPPAAAPPRKAWAERGGAVTAQGGATPVRNTENMGAPHPPMGVTQKCHV